MVTFQLFARPLLDALAGSKPQPLPFAQASLKAEFTTKTGLTRFLPAQLGGTHERPEVELVRWQGSGDLMAVSACELLHCGTTRSRAVRCRRSDDGPAVLRFERWQSGTTSRRSCRTTMPPDGRRWWTFQPSSQLCAKPRPGLRGDEPGGHAGAAAKSQRRSAGSRPRGRDHGRQAHCGTHPHVPSPSAEQSRRSARGAGRTESPFAASPAQPPSLASKWKRWWRLRSPR